MAIENIMERIVADKLEKLLESSDYSEYCKCEDCKNDMMAFALNHIQPKYVNSKKGELFGRIDSTKLQNNVAIDVEVAKAIELIGSSPKHDKK